MKSRHFTCFIHSDSCDLSSTLYQHKVDDCVSIVYGLFIKANRNENPSVDDTLPLNSGPES